MMAIMAAGPGAARQMVLVGYDVCNHEPEISKQLLLSTCDVAFDVVAYVVKVCACRACRLEQKRRSGAGQTSKVRRLVGNVLQMNCTGPPMETLSDLSAADNRAAVGGRVTAFETLEDSPFHYATQAKITATARYTVRAKRHVCRKSVRPDSPTSERWLGPRCDTDGARK